MKRLLSPFSPMAPWRATGAGPGLSGRALPLARESAGAGGCARAQAAGASPAGASAPAGAGAPPRVSRASGAPDRSLPAAARAVLALLERLAVGELALQLPDGSHQRFGQARPGAPRAVLTLHDWRVCADVLRAGDIGFAQGYIDGHWSTPDLAALLRLMLANRQALEAVVYGRWWGGLLHRLRHLLRRNSRAGSRRNIHAHYDIGNAFYRLWLDPTMNYSSAWFNGQRGGDLVAAQQAKMRRALHEAGVRRGSRVLEIGCGWGAVAELAAGELGADLTGITLSTEQLQHGQARLRAAGLAAGMVPDGRRDADAAAAGQARLRLQDYRDVADGPYDAIVSIEMFEAVGEAWWPTYFDAIARLLRPGGRACIQVITIDEALFERYRRGTDFIQQYIFPGGMLPSPDAFRRQAMAAGLSVERELAFGADYAETLRRWRDAFVREEAAVRAQGFDERFLRTWLFYLAYCEAGFDSGSTDVMQFTLQRPWA